MMLRTAGYVHKGPGAGAVLSQNRYPASDRSQLGIKDHPPFRSSRLGTCGTALACATVRTLKISHPRLDAMCDKGLVLDIAHPGTDRTLYFPSPPVAGFVEFFLMRTHDAIPEKPMVEALKA